MKIALLLALIATTTPHNDPIAPSGTLTALGRTVPLREVVDRSGKWIAVANAGGERHSIAIVDAATGKQVARVTLPVYTALDFSADDKTLLVASPGTLTQMAFDPATGRLGAGRVTVIDDIYQTVLHALPGGDVLIVTRTLVPNAEASPRDSGRILPSTVRNDRDVTVELADMRREQFALERISVPTEQLTDATTYVVRWKVPLPGLPSSLTVTPDGTRAFVTAWLDDRLSIIDLNQPALIANVPVPAHPMAAAYAPQRRLLYVACGGTNSVAVVDSVAARVLGTIDVGGLRGAALGATPNGLALTRDEDTLYVANADENVVIRVAIDGRSGTAAGAIPVGVYPADIALSPDEHTLYVVDAHGRGPGPTQPKGQPDPELGLLERVDLASIDDVAGLHALRNREQSWAADAPHLPPIKHVIYVLKENKTYDAILGDDPRGNGDPQLTMFGRRITPNEHAIADDFVLADNFRLESEASVDGWQFAFGAYTTDFLQRTWEAGYGNQPLPGGMWGGAGWPPADELEIPPGGYIWDDALAAGRSVRLYDMFPEFLTDAAYGAAAPILPGVVADDVDSDSEAFGQWLDEFRAYEKNGNLPDLEVVALSGDHTDGTTPYQLTPNAMVAKNDYYVGQMVDALSHSKFWKDTVIFFIEDDPGGTPDHVNLRRSFILAAGGYVKRHAVDHTAYSMTGLLHTIEMLLGLKPMNEYDATSPVMSTFFSDTYDLAAYSMQQPQVSLAERNPPNAVDANVSLQMRFERPDENEPGLLAGVLWDYALAAGNLPRSRQTYNVKLSYQRSRSAFNLARLAASM
jgi:YVTN family beta-propeller protein